MDCQLGQQAWTEFSWKDRRSTRVVPRRSTQTCTKEIRRSARPNTPPTVLSSSPRYLTTLIPLPWCRYRCGGTLPLSTRRSARITYTQKQQFSTSEAAGCHFQSKQTLMIISLRQRAFQAVPPSTASSGVGAEAATHAASIYRKHANWGVVYFMPLEGWREDRQHPLSVVRQLLVSHPKMGQLSDPM